MSTSTVLAIAPLVVLVIGFVAYCIVDIVRHDVRTLPKWLWIVISLVSIPLGGILYLVLGRAEPELELDTAAAPTGAAIGTIAPGSPPAMRSFGTTPATPDVIRARPADGRPPILTTSGLTKVYDGTVGLENVDLRVPRGSVYGLVGPNGAGKTTLLSLLAGLRRPTSGTISMDVPRERLAVLPDTPSFDPWLTAREVIDLARHLVNPALPAERTMGALMEVGLDDVADRRVGGFSRGMLQRLGLGATIVGDPELLLLDEPCSALDPLGRREVLDLVGRLGGDRTVVFCSHILGDVQEVCDTVGVLRHGSLLYQGPLTDLLVGRAAPAFTVRLRPPAAPAAEALRREPWVTDVEQIGADELRVTAASLDDAEHHLVRVLAECDARVISIVPAAGDLEHVFLQVTA